MVSVDLICSTDALARHMIKIDVTLSLKGDSAFVAKKVGLKNGSLNT